MSLKTRFVLIRIVAVILALYTIVWGVAPYSSVNISARFLIDILDWPLDSFSLPLDRNTMWLSAIGAGLLGACAVFLWGIVAPAVKKGDIYTVRVTILAFLVWYLIDGAGSIAVGIWSNVVFNTIYLIFIIAPLIGLPKK